MPQAHTAPDPIRVLVVDDHPLFLEGLSLVLRDFDQPIELLTEGSLTEAKKRLLSALEIDLVLLDLDLPDGKGLSLVTFIKEHKLFVPCIIISASDDKLDVKTALKAGASGFISKAAKKETILWQLKQGLKGDITVPDFASVDGLHPLSNNKLDITPRQKDVLELLAEGLPNKAICQRLNLTEHTIKSHLKTLFQILEVHSRTECVKVARLMGYIN